MAGIPWENVQALKRNGVDARLVTFKYPPHRPHMIDVNLGLDRERRLWRRQLVQWRTFARFLPWADVFHFYFGLTLVPARAQFPLLGLARKKSIYHFLGSDIRGKSPAALAYGKRAGAQIVGSYDAAHWVPEAEVVPPGLDLREYEPAPPSDSERPVVLHAPSNRAKKGTEHVLAACAELPVELEIVEGLHHDEARARYRRADIVVDQLHAGWYGIFAIEAMALGKPVVSFLHDEARRRTGEAFGRDVPIVQATKETLAEALRPLIESPAERRRIGAESRAYVEHVHDGDVMADRLLDIYSRLP
jgi:glycosyltransferase involved in cell wall biosynthesis